MSIWYTLDDNEQPVQSDFLVFSDKDKTWTPLKDTVNGYEVSTVFLALNHSFVSDEGPPILWETMIFGLSPEQEENHGEYQERYTSAKEARSGHEVAKQWVLDNLPEKPS